MSQLDVCRYGFQCSRPDCWFAHPVGRAIDDARGDMCELSARYGAQVCPQGLRCLPLQIISPSSLPVFNLIISKLPLHAICGTTFLVSILQHTRLHTHYDVSLERAHAARHEAHLEAFSGHITTDHSAKHAAQHKHKHKHKRTPHTTRHTATHRHTPPHTATHRHTHRHTHRTPHTAHRTPHTAHRTPHNAQRTQHNAHSTTHTAQRTQHTAHSTQHTAHSTQHTAHSTQHTAARPRQWMARACAASHTFERTRDICTNLESTFQPSSSACHEMVRLLLCVEELEKIAASCSCVLQDVPQGDLKVFWP